MKKLIFKFLKYFVILFMFLNFSCGEKFEIGNYIYESSYQYCEIIITEDGKFRQKIKYKSTGEEIKNDGIWEKRNSSINFSPFLSSIGDAKNTFSNPPKRFGSFTGVIRGKIIVFDEGYDYSFSLAK